MGRPGTELAGTPGGGCGQPCPAWAFRAEHRPAFSERTGAGGTSGVAGEAIADETDPLQAFQARSPRLGNLWRFRGRIAPDVEVRKRDFPRIGTLASPYVAYREMVKRRFPEKMDASRLDATVALYMRCAGYTPQEVANELYRHTPARPKGENRDERIEYGRRVVWYAFGTAGNIEQYL